MVAATILLHNELPTKCEHICRNELQDFGGWNNYMPKQYRRCIYLKKKKTNLNVP